MYYIAAPTVIVAELIKGAPSLMNLHANELFAGMSTHRQEEKLGGITEYLVKSSFPETAETGVSNILVMLVSTNSDRIGP